MKEETKIDKDYLENFNLGYELAKELNLTSPIFQDLNSENSRMKAMQEGMVQYNKDISQGKNKEIDRPLELDNEEDSYRDMSSEEGSNTDNGKGFDLSIWDIIDY